MTTIFKTLRISIVTLFLLTVAHAAFAWTLSGTIYGDSNKLSGATLSLVDVATMSSVGITTTDTNGFYNFTVTDGTYRMTVSANGYPESVVNPDINISGGDKTQNVVLLSPINSSVTGIVRAPDGTGISNLNVYINDQSSGLQQGNTTTDANGSFSFTVASGNYSIVVNYYGMMGSVSNVALPNGFSYTLWSNQAVSGATTLSDKTLPIVTLSGRTTDSNGVAIANVSVYRDYGYPGNGTEWGSVYGENVTSDASGNYSMVTLAYSNYAFTLTPPNGSGFAITPLNGVDITKNIAQNIILTLTDLQAPVLLSGPTITSISSSSAVVEWQTNEPTSGGVAYGTDNPTVVNDTNDTGSKTLHSVTLTGLTPQGTYYVSVFGADGANNALPTTASVSFVTLALPDTIAPTILSGPVVTSIGTSSAVVEFTTSEPVSCSVVFGLSNTLGSSAACSTTGTNHRVNLTGLTAETLYYLKISATDLASNGPTTSSLATFNTTAVPDNKAPVIVEGPFVTSISDSSATVVWATNEPATSGVSFNDGTAYGVVTDNILTQFHSVTLTRLSASTPYNFTVACKDALANGPTLSSSQSFYTLAAPDTTPPVLIESPMVVTVNHQSAVIRWRTDEAASSLVEYGLSSDVLAQSEARASLTQPHNMSLTGLEAGTLYYFHVLSTDAVGNTVTSLTYNFTTDIAPDTKKPIVTKGPEVAYTSENKMIVSWETDEPTDTVLEYNLVGESPLRNSKLEREQKHQVTLVDLTPSTTYKLAVSATDAGGNTTLAKLSSKPILLAFVGDAGVFVPKSTANTADNADLTAPVITAGPTVEALSDTSITLHWVTNEISDSTVSYGLSGGNLNMTAGEMVDAAGHVVVLTNLSPSTSYDYRVTSVDPSGNSTTSNPAFFTTAADPDTSGPVISLVAVTVGSDSATVTWSTDEPSSSVVRYGLASTSYTKQASRGGLTLDHSITLTGLESTKTYYFVVESTDSSSNVATSSESTLTTAAGYNDTIAPYAPVVTGVSPTSNNQPTWSWSGDNIGGNGTFRYRLDNSDLSGGQLTTIKAFTPSTLLTEGSHTLYVQERDDAGNWSSVSSFTILIDTIAPSVTLTSSLTGPSKEMSTVLNFSTNEGTLLLTHNSTSISLSSGDSLTLVEGSNTISASATDDAGNSGSVTVTITVDTQIEPPTIATLPYSWTQTSYTLSGQMENGATVEVSASAGIVVEAVTYPTATTWQCIVSSLNTGLVGFTVVATDPAGNGSSPAMASLNVLISTNDTDGDGIADRDDVAPTNAADNRKYCDSDNNGTVEAADALVALKIVIGKTSLNPTQKVVLDVAPLINGKPAPDGKVTAADALVILRKAVGLW